MINKELIDKLSLFNANTTVGSYISKFSNIALENDKLYKYKRMIHENSEDAENGPFLSVITRTQGSREEALREMLLCLAAQSDMDFEVIILGHYKDDSKRERILSIISEQVKELHDRIRYIQVEEGNRTTPLNYGFACAKGQYISILDDDDIVFDNWVENFKNGAGIANGCIIRAYAFTQEWEIIGSESRISGLRAVKAPQPTYCSDFEFSTQLNGNSCPTMSLAYPAYIFKQLNIIFDESLNTLEDWDFLMRTVFLCGIYDTREATSIYRLWNNTNNSHSIHDDNEWLDNSINIQKKFLEYPVVMPEEFLKQLLNGTYSQLNCNGMNIISCGQKIYLKPKLYLDFGDGFSENNIIYGGFTFKNQILSVSFDLSKLEKEITAFRIDISEDTFMVLDELKINVINKDNSMISVSAKDIDHNGINIDLGLAFVKPDPMIIYNCHEKNEISTIKMETTLKECDIQGVLDKIIKHDGLFKRTYNKIKHCWRE